MAFRILLKQKIVILFHTLYFYSSRLKCYLLIGYKKKILDHSSKTMALDSTEQFLFIQFNVARGYVSSMSLTRTHLVPIQPKCP